MERALYRLSVAWVLGVLLSAPCMAYDAEADAPSDTTPSLCLDGMETVPIEDDLPRHRIDLLATP